MIWVLAHNIVTLHVYMYVGVVRDYVFVIPVLLCTGQNIQDPNDIMAMVRRVCG